MRMVFFPSWYQSSSVVGNGHHGGYEHNEMLASCCWCSGVSCDISIRSIDRACVATTHAKGSNVPLSISTAHGCQKPVGARVRRTLRMRKHTHTCTGLLLRAVIHCMFFFCCSKPKSFSDKKKKLRIYICTSEFVHLRQRFCLRVQATKIDSKALLTVARTAS